MAGGEHDTDTSEGGTRFAALVASFAGRPDIVFDPTGTAFGSRALKAGGKIFAMHVRGQLVVKLPKGRVDALVESGAATRFDANKGRPFREWAALPADSAADWQAVAEEALAFVGPRA